jgi:serine/threonine-protein phosphatase PGAM5
MAHRTILLIRHGQYDPEQGKEDPLGSGLTNVGIQQAERAAEYLAAYPLSALHTSSLLRAVQTAEIIASRHPHLKIAPSDLLREITPPVPYLAMKYVKEISTEKISRDGKQVEQAYHDYFRPAGENDEYEAIVCHGNVIRYFACRALQVSTLAWMNLEIYNCSISAIEIDAYGNTLLLSYNESAFLLEDLKTQNQYPMGLGYKK